MRIMRPGTMGAIGGFAMAASLLSSCVLAPNPATPSPPASLNPGTVEYQLRPQELRSALSGITPGVPNTAAPPR